MRPQLSPFAWPPQQDNRVPNDINASRKSAIPASMRPPPGSPATGPLAASAPTFQPGRYGEAISLAIPFAGAGALMVLARPSSGIRTLLIINNTIAGFAIVVGYDSAPNVGGGVQIATGGNLFFDSVVPQNDIWVFAPAAGIVQLQYMIDNISKG